SWRLLFMTFHGAPRADEKTMAHVHESPKVMILPLFVLAAGACFAGYLGYENFVGHKAAEFWGNSILILDHHKALENAHHVPLWVKLAPLVVGAVGIGLAYILYIKRTDLPAKIANAYQGVYQFLLNKWYFDELYDAVFVRPSFVLGRGLWKVIDGWIIDGLGPDGISNTVRIMARRIAALQSGYLYHYAFAMLIGVVVIASWYLFTRVG
ncbi:MAG: NADH-quinone oxidoreductase subunit L, partial [Rhodospirillaceae bacterium]|nr:NADH-quinone oxidoreductase subunit L [Rhodospirillaceae bacterium]